MRRFIFNTQGTGISHEQVRRLENTQPGPGTYLESDMSGHPLGDEIMLLDGLEDAMHDMGALEALGYVGAGNYKSRAADMSGFSLSASDLAAALPSQRRAGREFAPYGLGQDLIERGRPSMVRNRAKADLRVLKVGAGGRSHPAGRRLRREFRPYGLGQPPQAQSAEVSPYTVAKGTRPDLFIGPRFYPLERMPAEGRADREFSPYGLGVVPETYPDQHGPGTYLDGFAEPGVRLETLSGDGSYEKWSDTPPPGTYLDGDRDYRAYGLGDAASDRRQALATATSIRNACRAACGIIQERTPTLTTQAQARCRSGCDAAYSAAEAAINSALPPGTAGGTTPDQQAIINQKLRALEQSQYAAEQGRDPGQAYEQASGDGLSTNQMLLIGAGVLGVGILAIVALRK